ncbi:hypothetical protein HD554DRAFT_2172456 [Boletus coccyginus]|nr:hypothetical protein HD554DRAFT_2172456 [Boletus coccyginus]
MFLGTDEMDKGHAAKVDQFFNVFSLVSNKNSLTKLKASKRKNQLLESLVELKEEELYVVKEEELEEEFFQDEEEGGEVAKELAGLIGKKMEEVLEDEGESGESEEGSEE